MLGRSATPRELELARAAIVADAERESRPRATGGSARARHVLVDSEYQAMLLYNEIMSGASIGALAAEHSKCKSSAEGGDLGSFAPGDMVPEWDEFVFDTATPIGIPLGPLKTSFGYHVLIIDERVGVDFKAAGPGGAVGEAHAALKADVEAFASSLPTIDFDEETMRAEAEENERRFNREWG